jgi:hypothetical protein
VGPSGVDPISAAIEAYKQADEVARKAHDALFEAECTASKKHGHRPSTLITWRDWHIGGTEVDDRREAFLRKPGANVSEIEKEYQAAKARERAAEDAAEAWDERTGVSRRALWPQCRRGFEPRPLHRSIQRDSR